MQERCALSCGLCAELDSPPLATWAVAVAVAVALPLALAPYPYPYPYPYP